MPRVKEKEQEVKNVEIPVAQENLEVAAYFHWLGRGCPENDALTDWVEAEKHWVEENQAEHKNN